MIGCSLWTYKIHKRRTVGPSGMIISPRKQRPTRRYRMEAGKCKFLIKTRPNLQKFKLCIPESMDGQTYLQMLRPEDSRAAEGAWSQ